MKIVIISAMKIELEYLLSKVHLTTIKKRKKLEIQYASFGNHELILATCGVGKVNAAIFTQMLLDTETVDLVLNVGIAGGLSDALPLEVVLRTSYCHHDVRPNQMAALFPFQQVFEPRKELINRIKGIPELAIKCGRISSGENFVDNPRERERIYETFQPHAVDMETSAIAHCCYINNINFIALRCISDLADENADKNYASYEQIAAEKAGSAVLKILENLD